LKIFKRKLKKKNPPKAIPKVGGCSLCYPTCTPKRYLKALNRKIGRDTDNQRSKTNRTKRGVEE